MCLFLREKEREKGRETDSQRRFFFVSKEREREGGREGEREREGGRERERQTDKTRKHGARERERDTQIRTDRQTRLQRMVYTICLCEINSNRVTKHI